MLLSHAGPAVRPPWPPQLPHGWECHAWQLQAQSSSNAIQRISGPAELRRWRATSGATAALLLPLQRLHAAAAGTTATAVQQAAQPPTR